MLGDFEQRGLTPRIDQIIAPVERISAQGGRLLARLFGLNALLVLRV